MTRFLLGFVLSLAILGCGANNSPIKVEAEGSIPVSTPQPDPDSILVAAVGDIMLGSPFPNDTRMPPNDGADLLKPVTSILSAADVAFGNLEGPMIDSGISAKCKPPKPPAPGADPEPVNCFAFRMPTRYARHLKNAGFDVLSVANNHAGDYGDVGRASTRKALEAEGLKFAGSDRSKYSTAYLEVKGKKIAVVGFAHNNVVPNVNDLAFARRLVLEAASKADIVIVSFHGGAEGTAAQHVPNATETYFGEKRGNLRQFARTVIDAGADLVIGHGPHVLRGMEIYKDRLIAYSMGNFATYGWFRLEAETALSAILEARLAADGKFLGGRLIAARQNGRGGPVLDDSGEAINKIRALSMSDFGASAPKIAPDGTISPE